MSYSVVHIKALGGVEAWHKLPREEALKVADDILVKYARRGRAIHPSIHWGEQWHVWGGGVVYVAPSAEAYL